MMAKSPSQALRRQADRALRISRAISDEQAAQALRLHATGLFEQAEALERGHAPLLPQRPEQHPAQQQQQVQPGSEDEKK
jgi:hypothetical protein